MTEIQEMLLPPGNEDTSSSDLFVPLLVPAFIKQHGDMALLGAPLQAVVIGGGYIGLEMTASLRSNGLDVTVVLPQEHFLSRMLTDEVGKFYESYYKEKGVTIRAKARAVSFEPKSPGCKQVTFRKALSMD